MRALLNFQNRDGWSFHLLAEDCQTVLTKWRPIEPEDALLGMIAKMHGDMAQAKNSISQWGRGLPPSLFPVPAAVPQASLINPTPLNLHNASPPAAPFKRLDRTRPPVTQTTDTLTVGRIRYSTNVSGPRDEALKGSRIASV
jgi:hypothetical protein